MRHFAPVVLLISMISSLVLCSNGHSEATDLHQVDPYRVANHPSALDGAWATLRHRFVIRGTPVAVNGLSDTQTSVAPEQVDYVVYWNGLQRVMSHKPATTLLVDGSFLALQQGPHAFRFSGDVTSATIGTHHLKLARSVTSGTFFFQHIQEMSHSFCVING